MTMKYCGIIGLLLAGSVAFVLPTDAHAQTNTNPYDVVLKIIKNADLDNLNSTSDACTSASRFALGCQQSLGKEAKLVTDVRDDLFDKLGVPESRRGLNYVWKLDNPSISASQKDTVTVILTYDPAGESSIMVDRVRPGTVFARAKRNPKAETKPGKLKQSTKKRVDPIAERAKQF